MFPAGKDAAPHHPPCASGAFPSAPPPRVPSAGNAASRSTARTIVPLRSRRTISSPRREISTSLLFNRNCFGSRTAWLFPDLNTLAVAILNLLKCIYVKYTHCALRRIRGSPPLAPPAPRHSERSGSTFSSAFAPAIEDSDLVGKASACAVRPLSHHARFVCVMKSLFVMFPSRPISFSLLGLGFVAAGLQSGASWPPFRSEVIPHTFPQFIRMIL